MNFNIFIIASLLSVAISLNIPEKPNNNPSSSRLEAISEDSDSDPSYLIFEIDDDDTSMESDDDNVVINLISPANRENRSFNYISLQNFSNASTSRQFSSNTESSNMSLTNLQLDSASLSSMSEDSEMSLSNVEDWTTFESQNVSDLTEASLLLGSNYTRHSNNRSYNSSVNNSTSSTNSTGSGERNPNNSETEAGHQNSDVNSETALLETTHDSDCDDEMNNTSGDSTNDTSDKQFKQNEDFQNLNEIKDHNHHIIMVHKDNNTENSIPSVMNFKTSKFQNTKKARQADFDDDYLIEEYNYEDDELISNEEYYPNLRIVINKDKSINKTQPEKQSTTLRPVKSKEMSNETKNLIVTTEKSLIVDNATEQAKVILHEHKENSTVIPIQLDKNKFTTPNNFNEDSHHENCPNAFHPEENDDNVDFDENINLQCPSTDDIVRELDYFNINNLQRPIWHSYTFNTGAYNREELRIIEVVAEKSFNVDKQIIEWVSAGIHGVGLGPHGLTLLTSHLDGVHIDNHEYNEHVTTMAIFEWWNKLERAMETCLLTVHEMTINWHQLRGDNQLEQLWSWKMNDPIIHLNIFMYDKKWKLAVTSEHGDNYERCVSIYGMDLWENWWFEQKLTGHGKPTVINNGKFIAVPLSDTKTVSVYKYNLESKKYECFKNFTSPEVVGISAFTAGSNSFLAIGGEQSAIYQIMGDKFIEKTLHNYRLDHVELWLPISLGYFRNDAIVLFQHKLDHYTHSSSILEALQWNGEMFVLLEHSPCKSHDEEMFGFACILDAEGEKGLKGAAIFRSVDGKVSVITASEEYTPIMFEIKTELIAVPDPVNQEVENILSMQKTLQDRFIAQLSVIEEAEKIIQHAVHHDQDSVIADNWQIKELHAPAIHIDGNLRDFLSENSYINLGGQDLKNVDLDIDISRLFEQINNNHNRMKTMIHKLKNAVMKNEDLSNSMEDIVIKGGISVRGKVQIKNAEFESLNGVKVDHALKDTVKITKDRKLVIKGRKTLKNLKTDNVDVSMINGIEILGPTAHKFKPIIIEGDLVMPNRLNILKDIHIGEFGTVNDINLKEDVFTSNNKMKRDIPSEKPLIFDSIKVMNSLIAEDNVNGFDFTAKGLKKTIADNPNSEFNPEIESQEEMNLRSLSVGKGLFFTSINGRPWADYIDRIVLKNENIVLDKLRITRSVTADDGLNVETLNDITFPTNYVTMNESSAIKISAPKIFTADLEATVVDCEETVSDIDPQRIVTLNSPQNLDNFTFIDLTVTEGINVNGDITGEEFDAFLSNPKLTESNNIKSNVIFRSLQVNGNVNVQNRINGSDWDSIVGDIILKTNEALSIDSLKTFNGHISVEKGLNVQSGFINNRRLKEFMTTDTDQIIDSDVLNGDLRFETLTVGGMFDGVNIRELEQNIVRLSTDQTIMADLTFDDANNSNEQEESNATERSLFNVDANSLKVTEMCNDWRVPSDAVFIDDENIVLDSPEFSKVHVDHLIVEGNLLTKKHISGIDLNEFNGIRLSKSEDREVTAPYTILSSKMNNLDFNFFNDMHKDQINNFIQQVDNMKEEIKAGNVNIGTLHASDKLDVSKINGIDIRQMAEDAVWLKEENNITRKIKFVDRIFTKHLKLNRNAFQKNFENHMYDIIQKTDENVVVTGKKTYIKGLINENITAEYINDIKASNLMTVYDDQIIDGDVYIKGDVVINKNIDVKSVNNISMKGISEKFKYLDNDEYFFNGSFYFENDCQIDSLIVNGLVNNHYNPELIISSAVNIYEDNHFENHVTFKNPVTMKKNLDISDTYNGMYLKTLVENTVFINENAIINSSVIFKSPLTVEGELKIHGNLNCQNIQNCDMEEWKNNAVYLDRAQQLNGVKHFNKLTINGDINVKYINDVAMSDLIPLNSDHSIEKVMKFDKVELDNDLHVGGLVNSVKLDEEFDNCLMADGDQTIMSPIHFHSNVYVTNDAYIDRVNTKPLNNIVTLDSDQNLFGIYNFEEETYFDGNLNVSGTISDIDFDLWLKNAVFANDFGSSDINGNWNILGDLYIKEDIQGRGVINGIDVHEINNFLKDNDMKGKQSELDLISQYKTLCNELNRISDVSNKQVYLFKYLEEIQTISSMQDIIMHQFTHVGLNFILMSKKGFCESDIWMWNTESGVFANIMKMHTGCVNKWYTTKQGPHTYLISLSGLECNCKFGGVDLWSFDGITLQHINNLPPADYILTPLGEQGTYYSIEDNMIHKYELLRKLGTTVSIERGVWPVQGNVFAILPFKSANGIILTNGRKLTELPQYNGMVTGINNEIKLTTVNNDHFALADEILNFKVGTDKRLTAFVWSKEDSNNSTDGAITIYEDFLEDKIFQKIACYKPTSLTVVQLNNYQTLMAFIENFNSIKIYSYQGYQGFKYLYSLNMPANTMEVVTVNMIKYLDNVRCLLVASDEAVHVIQIFMYGDRSQIHHVPCYL